MIDLQEMYEWRWKDESNGLVLPYYTKPFLDELQKMDLEGKSIFEYGIGGSTIWYSKKHMRLYGVESSPAWFEAVVNTEPVENKGNIQLEIDPVKYPKVINEWDTKFDIIVIDGIERDKCIQPALDKLADNGIIIIDNFNQHSVWIPSFDSWQILKGQYIKLYPQPDHYDWQTAVITKP